MIADRRVLVGVSGGIAIYKTCNVVRQLTEAGAAVDVVMTASATEFVRPVTFEALSKRPVLTSLWQRDRALAHIHLGQESDLILLAPTTANILAKAAHGIADDLLTAILLACEAPVLAAPAMNDRMWANPATMRNVEELAARGWQFVGPEVGNLAEGPSARPGRMAEPEEIVAHSVRLIRSRTSALNGKRVLVTAGPTREQVDPVRVISNPSSGRMGYAVAEAAFARGADVRLVTGPSQLAVPCGVDVARVETTDELCATVGEYLGETDVLVMAAAPADYRPVAPSGQKLQKTDGAFSIEVEPTTDVLMSTLDRRPPGSVIVGFALESEDGLARARAKLERKQLDLIVLNMAREPGAGFETPSNRVSFISKDEVQELPLMPKLDVAERLLDRIETLL
ncbi:bifunctional phosphopantothenoylcysteine decarboxylase/phosphopantothenate--cysteine ligase CoaBC [Gemmatimonadota bacterium]